MVQRMEDDLRDFPKMFATDDDDIHVWGWNKALKARLLRHGIDASLLPTDEQIDEIRRLASREYAVEYAHRFYSFLRQQQCSCITSVVGNAMQMIADTAQLPAADPEQDYITKTLWSSSGRGIRIVRDGKFPKPPFLLDRFYVKRLDFAMEFCVRESSVDYLGLSVFEASADGKYAFNYVRSQADLMQMVTDAGVSHVVIHELAEMHRQLLMHEVAGRYRGIVGIDMMVVENHLVHPCVELNFRMNMGVAAMRLYERYGDDEKELVCGNPHGFQAKLCKGMLSIVMNDGIV